MSHTALRREFSDLIELDASVDRLAGGFTFTEGPIWNPRDQHLLFSDMPADVRRRWDERGGVREVLKPSNKCNGMTYDANLGLIVCEHATSSLIRERDGRREILASHFEGKELNSPNDVCVRSDGSIYFSDPWYGRMPVYGVERPRQQGFQGVYRVPPGGGEPQLLVDRQLFEQPNGLCFSPDEKLLYITDTGKPSTWSIRVFDCSADNKLTNGRVFHDFKGKFLSDDIRSDEDGNIWSAGGWGDPSFVGVSVYAPDGTPLGRIVLPETAGNLCFGGYGHNHSFLYITAGGSLYQIPVHTRGVEL
jgi:gluconolactonase